MLVAVVLALSVGLTTAFAAPVGAEPLGQVHSFGSAADHGSPGRIRLPVVGMASTPSGNGYWAAATDGGVFAEGDAGFFGSTGNIRLQKPIVGMAPSLSGQGYWFVATDGGVFAYGDAPFKGSLGATPLTGPVVGMARPTPRSDGYWLIEAGDVSTDVCIADPAAEDPDTASHPQIDIVRTCLRATPAGIVFEVTVRQGMTRDQLMQSLRNQSRDDVDSTFYDVTLLRSPTTYANGLSFGAEGNNPTVDVFSSETDPNEVPNHLTTGLAVNGSTYTFGPVPYSALAPTNVFYFGAVTTYDKATGGGSFDSFFDFAPEGDAPAGPISR